MFSAIRWEGTKPCRSLALFVRYMHWSIIIMKDGLVLRVVFIGWVIEAIHACILINPCMMDWFKDCMSPHPVNLLYSFMVHIMTVVRCPGAGMVSTNDVYLLASV